MEQVNIFLVDDHKLFRKGMAELINSFSGYAVCGEAGNGNELIRIFPRRDPPDIVILDMHMPEKDGHDTALWLRDNFPSVKVLALSMNDREEMIIRMLKAGARGYLLKDAEPAELLAALDALSRDGFYHSELVSTVLLNSLNDRRHEGATLRLNERELQFLKLACTELTYKEIADQMCLSPRTIDGYREALFERLQVKSRVGLVLFAMRAGVI